MAYITLGVPCFIFILRQVFYCGLTVEAIYNTTYFRMKKRLLLVPAHGVGSFYTDTLPAKNYSCRTFQMGRSWPENRLKCHTSFA